MDGDERRDGKPLKLLCMCLFEHFNQTLTPGCCCQNKMKSLNDTEIRNYKKEITAGAGRLS